MNTSSSVIRRLNPRSGVKVVVGPPQKDCEQFEHCKKTLSAKSKHKKCVGCRRADEHWGDADMDSEHIWTYFHRAELQVFRIGQHLPKRAASVRKRA